MTHIYGWYAAFPAEVSITDVHILAEEMGLGPYYTTAEEDFELWREAGGFRVPAVPTIRPPTHSFSPFGLTTRTFLCIGVVYLTGRISRGIYAPWVFNGKRHILRSSCHDQILHGNVCSRNLWVGFPSQFYASSRILMANQK